MSKALSKLPSVDRLLRDPAVDALCADHGQAAVKDFVRTALARRRARTGTGAEASGADLHAALVGEIVETAAARGRARIAPVFNLTGTLLHTNLGRAVLPQAAIDAMNAVAGAPSVWNTTCRPAGAAIGNATRPSASAA